MLKKIQLAALIVVTAFASGTPAYAHGGGKPERCEHKLERIEHRFRVIEARYGYEFASKWWNEFAWPKYYARCGG